MLSVNSYIISLGKPSKKSETLDVQTMGGTYEQALTIHLSKVVFEKKLLFASYKDLMIWDTVKKNLGMPSLNILTLLLNQASTRYLNSILSLI